MKPLFVPATADAMAGIGKAPSVAGCISDAMADKWKAVFEEVFPPRAGKKAGSTMVQLVSDSDVLFNGKGVSAADVKA